MPSGVCQTRSFGSLPFRSLVASSVHFERSAGVFGSAMGGKIHHPGGRFNRRAPAVRERLLVVSRRDRVVRTRNRMVASDVVSSATREPEPTARAMSIDEWAAMPEDE